MKRWERMRDGWRRRRGKLLADERGLTLIEILGAVTIMAVISTTLMGYFTAGLDRSADQSRRIIAANLARMKAAEIRDAVGPKAAYDALAAFARSSSAHSFRADSVPPPPIPGAAPLQADEINGTTYYYILDLDVVQAEARKGELAAMMNPASPDDYLLQMGIRVYWDGAPDSEPTAAKSTSVDSYVVNRG